jgi:hypothetical protein
MKDAHPHDDSPRRVIIMEQNTNGDKTVADCPAKENRAEANGKNIEPDK